MRCIQAAALLTALVLARVAHAAPPLFAPFAPGRSVTVTQGPLGTTHRGYGAFAFDFALDEADEIRAAAPGVVRWVRSDSVRGGCDVAFAPDANYVVVDHGDGTSALYLHLAAGSTGLYPGDRVEQGDFVGRPGSTGYSCGVHLHFQVQLTCRSWWCPSLCSSFADLDQPLVGARYTSRNEAPARRTARLARGAGPRSGLRPRVAPALPPPAPARPARPVAAVLEAFAVTALGLARWLW